MEGCLKILKLLVEKRVAATEVEARKKLEEIERHIKRCGDCAHFWLSLRAKLGKPIALKALSWSAMPRLAYHLARDFISLRYPDEDENVEVTWQTLKYVLPRLSSVSPHRWSIGPSATEGAFAFADSPAEMSQYEMEAVSPGITLSTLATLYEIVEKEEVTSTEKLNIIVETYGRQFGLEPQVIDDLKEHLRKHLMPEDKNSVN